jgi:hypothetical protein
MLFYRKKNIEGFIVNLVTWILKYDSGFFINLLIIFIKKLLIH